MCIRDSENTDTENDLDDILDLLDNTISISRINEAISNSSLLDTPIVNQYSPRPPNNSTFAYRRPSHRRSRTVILPSINNTTVTSMVNNARETPSNVTTLPPHPMSVPPPPPIIIPPRINTTTTRETSTTTETSTTRETVSYTHLTLPTIYSV